MNSIYFRPARSQESFGHNTKEKGRATFRLARIVQDMGSVVVNQELGEEDASDPWAWRKGLDRKIGAADFVVVDASDTLLLTNAELSIAQAHYKPAFVMYRSDRQQELQRLIDHFDDTDPKTPVYFARYDTDPSEVASRLATFMGETAIKTVPVVN